MSVIQIFHTSDDGRRIAATTHDSEVYFYDVSRGVRGICVGTPILRHGQGLKMFVMECYSRRNYRYELTKEEDQVMEELRQAALQHQTGQKFTKEERYEWLRQKFNQAYFDDSVDADNPVKAEFLSKNSSYRWVRFTLIVQEGVGTLIDLDATIKHWMEQGL